MKIRALLVSVFFLPLFLGILGCGRRAQEGTAAPDFKLTVLGDPAKEVALSELVKSHPVLLVFWATWCPGCVEEISHINEIQRKYKDQGLVVYGINVQESQEEILEFQKSHQMEYPVLLDTAGEVAEAYGVVGLPASVLVAKGGKIHYYGFALPGSLERLFQNP